MLQFKIFLYVLIFSKFCESFVLYRQYQNETNFVQTCVTNQIKDNNWALTMSSKSIQNYIPLNSIYEHGEYIDAFNDSTEVTTKNIGRSIHYKLPHVLDKRWEDFETINLEPHKKFTKTFGNEKLPILHLSLLFEGEIKITIHSAAYSWCAFLNNSVKKIQLVLNGCKSAQHTEEKSEGYTLWRHYTIYLSEKRAYMLQDSTEFQDSSRYPINIDAIEFSSVTNAFLKIHDYTFLTLDQTSTDVFFSSAFSMPIGEENLGICMYIYVNTKCNLTVVIEDTNTRAILSQEGYSGEDRWILKHVHIETTIEPMQMIIGRIGSCEMTFVDDVRFCSKDESRKLVFESSSQSDSCANTDNQIITYDDPYPLLSKNLNYERYKHLHNIEKLVICTEHSFCFCPPGYVGTICKTDISDSLTLMEIHPSTALIAIKDIGYYDWSYVIITAKTGSHKHEFNITLLENSHTYEINHLYTNSIYNITIKYCTRKDCTYFQNIPFFIKTEKCIDIEQKNIIYSTTPYSITLRTKDVNIKNCPLDSYVLYINTTELGSLTNPNEIKNLSPDSLYTITISASKHSKHKRETDILLTFNITTDSRKAKEVNNLRIMNISTESAKIYFERPSSYEEIIKYQVKYSILRHQACENNTYLPEKTVYIIPPGLMTELIQLKPFSEYTVEICAITDIGCGMTINKTFKTQGLQKFIADEELISNFNNSSLNLTFPACELVKGNVTYTIIAICQEIYCEDEQKLVSFEYHFRNEYIHFSQHLRPFTNYDVYIILKRPNDRKYAPKITIRTPPGKPNPVENLTAYEYTNESISLRWKPPRIPTGIIEYYRIKTCLDDNCKYTNCNNSCSLWDGYICEVIHNLDKSEIYNIYVYAKNKNNDTISDSQMVRAAAFEYAPGRPRNLVAEYLWYGPIVLTWHHPEKTNGQLQYFEIYIYSDKTLINKESVPVETYKAVYTHQINYLNLYKIYEVSIKAGNSHLGLQSNTITVYDKAQILWLAVLAMLAVFVVVLILICTCIILLCCIRYYQPSKLKGMHLDPFNENDEWPLIRRNQSENFMVQGLEQIIRRDSYSITIEPEVEIEDTELEREPMDCYIAGWNGNKTFILSNYDFKTTQGKEILHTEILRDKSELLILLGQEDNEVLTTLPFEMKIKVFAFDLSNMSQIPYHIDQMMTIKETYGPTTILIHSRMQEEGLLFTKCFNMLCGIKISLEDLSHNHFKNFNDYGFVFYHYYKHQKDHAPYKENQISNLKDGEVEKYLESIGDLNRQIHYISHIGHINSDPDQSEILIKTTSIVYIVRNLELFSLKSDTGNPKLIVILGPTDAIQDVIKQVLSVDNKIFVYTTTINGRSLPVIQWIYEKPFIDKNQDKFYIFYYYYMRILKHFHPEEIHIYSKDVSGGVIIASDMFVNNLLHSEPFDIQKVIYTMMYDFRQLTVEYVGPFLFNLFKKYWIENLKHMTDSELNFDIKSYFPPTNTETNEVSTAGGTEVIQRGRDIITARARNIQFSDPVGDDKKNL